ncbi:M48 family metalloprotease [Tychonema sp. BBK16]|uniref:M48 family metalloprotease n=1 Tax=Tychonema sp. BBK16 TaxID=2699888 RepID=UPI001F24D31C|nr:M48 family metalloprotease [Tychonema sp. BBK16]
MTKFLFRAAIGLLMAFFGAITYYTNDVQNPVTGERQRVQLSPQQEVSLGLQSRSQMAAKYGGLYPGQSIQQYVDRVGGRVVNSSTAKQAPYPFEFHLLRDAETVNAFALPGGQVFITAGLLRRLNSEAQLAAVLGHEAGHVVGRHGAEHLAKQQLGRSLVTAVGVATSDERGGGQQAAVVAQAVNQVVSLRYGRSDEIESDRLGFQFMTEAGYDPKGIVEVMQILGSARKGEAAPEFLSSHPNPENRVEKLQALITENFPNGVPANLMSGREEFAKNVSGG